MPCRRYDEKIGSKQKRRYERGLYVSQSKKYRLAAPRKGMRRIPLPEYIWYNKNIQTFSNRKVSECYVDMYRRQNVKIGTR